MEFDPRYPVHEYQSRTEGAAVERQDVLRETCKGEIPDATESCSGHLGRSQLHHTREGPEQLLQFRTPMLYATGSNPWRLERSHLRRIREAEQLFHLLYNVMESGNRVPPVIHICAILQKDPNNFDKFLDRRFHQ